MAPELEESLGTELAAWKARGLLRKLHEPRELSAREGDFVSNDYLGLSQHPEIIEAAREALAQHGAGARASRLLGGGCQLDRAAEAACADWLSAESALLFHSGFQANLGLITSLVGRGDAIFSDAFNHASLVDASRLSRAEIFVHRHFDLDQLTSQLALSKGARRRLVLTEGVYSMDGDMSPLVEIAEICAKHDAWLVVDEAHSAGMLGEEGAGAWAAAVEAGADPRALVARTVTGGKALGANGAFLVGSKTLGEHLLQRARSFVFSTAVSPAVSGALTKAIEICRDADPLRDQARSTAKLIARELKLPAPASSILPVVIGDNEQAVAVADELARENLQVKAVRPPTVPEGTARLRISTHAYNSADAVKRLTTLLAKVQSRTERREPEVRSRSELSLQSRSPGLFVTGTDTDVGKTIVSALLSLFAARRGPVRYWKPVQTGTDLDTTTVGELATHENFESGTPCYEFPLPASPHAAAADVGKSIHVPTLDQALRHERAQNPEAPLIIELAGGLLVPYTSEVTQLGWLAAHRLPIVLVARSGLGTLNHTMLSLEALHARGLHPEVLFLVGKPHPSNRATLEQMSGIRTIYELPQLDELNTAALEAWLDDNDLRPLFRLVRAMR